MRKLLIPPFRNKNTLNEYAKIIDQIAENFVDHLPVGKKISLLTEIRHSMLEIIIGVLFGANDETKLKSFKIWSTQLLDISVSYQTVFRYLLKDVGGISRWRHLQKALSETDRFIYSEIRSRREDPETANQNDILALLLRTQTEDGELLNDKEIRDQLVTLLLAGHETTATTLAWVLERLIRNPDMLEKVKNELALGQTDEFTEAVGSSKISSR